ncbi:TolC family protein [Pinibacter soli]|uniref:TolC family protein n=1 Tax=Pinibacter soli TaxID=3044211 RepID=A0ABT6RF52_9BACT|nr:TolC family protein [Pinibacter soli]MDI3321091.1 TolC family protein [Pinibacter soli]
MLVLRSKAAKMTAYILVCISPLLSLAQMQSVSLQSLIDSATHHLPVLDQKRALVKSADAQVDNVRHNFLPSAVVADELTLGTDNGVPGSYWSFGIIPSTSSGIRSSNDYQPAFGNIAILYGQYNLINFGLKNAKVEQAKMYADVNNADLEKEIYLLKWQIAKLYFDLKKNTFQLEVDAQNVKRNEEIYKVIQAVTRSGIKAGADSSMALAELSKTRINYNQTLGQVFQLQQQLSYLTGIPQYNLSVDTTAKSDYNQSVQAILLQSDSAQNPLTDYYEKQKKVYDATEVLVKKSYMPKVLLSASTWARGSGIDYSGNFKTDPSYGLGYQRVNYMAGLTLSYDLFNGVHKRDELAVSKYNAQAIDYALQQQRLALQNANAQANDAINTANKNLQEIPVQIKSSGDTYNQKRAQYKAGIINLIDLTNASYVLYRSQTDYVRTLNDWMLANLDKAAATGNLDQFIQSIK